MIQAKLWLRGFANCRAVGSYADRTTDERRGQPELYVLPERRERPDDHDRRLRCEDGTRIPTRSFRRCGRHRRLPNSPVDVTNYGVTVQKSVTAPLMVIGLYSAHGTYDAQFLANYAYINLNDQLTRVPGIGNVQVFGAGQYPPVVVGQARSTRQARHHGAGSGLCDTGAKHGESRRAPIGGAPVRKGQEFTYSVRAQGRLSSPEEFGDIIIRETPDGGVVRVKDVARAQLRLHRITA